MKMVKRECSEWFATVVEKKYSHILALRKELGYPVDPDPEADLETVIVGLLLNYESSLTSEYTIKVGEVHE